MEIQELFENLTIKELKQQNIKTRTEIESKKEELRFLVAERYRDIIDAADTISDMKSCSNEISHSLKGINNICKRWNVNILHRVVESNKVDEMKKNEENLRYTVASQIKLLLNMSELIWNAIENSHFSEAAMLFNVCRNMAIHSQLSSDKYKIGNFNMELLFNRQWSSLQSLEETIGLIARKFLKSVRNKHNLEDVLDCLVSIVVLEDLSLEVILEEYLKCVEFQIQEWFSSRAATVNINIQLCSVATIIMTAVGNIRRLFLDGAVLLRMEELSRVVVQNMACVRGEMIYKYLPEQISFFKPALKSFQDNMSNVGHDAVISATDRWLNHCREMFESDFTASFSHLTSIKSVGEARATLQRVFVDPATEDLSPWNILERSNVSQWNMMISTKYSQRLQKIIQQRISTLFSDWSLEIEKLISANESMMSEEEFNEDSFFNYAWTECSKDVFFNSDLGIVGTNLSDNNIKNSENRLIFDSLYNHFSNYFDLGPLSSSRNCNFESLVVKSKMIRPEIFQITKNFNDKLLELVVETIDTVSDCDQFLSELLRECLTTIVDRSLSWLDTESQLSSSCAPIPKDRPKKPNGDISISCVQLRLLLTSQALRSICETSPAFQAGLMTAAVVSTAETSEPPTVTKQQHKSKTLRLPYLPGKRLQHQAEHEARMWNSWSRSIEPLQKASGVFVISAVRPSLVSLIGHYFENVRYSYSSAELCDYFATKWTNVTLPNTETPNVPLSFEVPSQCSWLMHRLVLNMSRLLSIFGGHSLSRQSLDEVRAEILTCVIAEFDRLRDSEDFGDVRNCQRQNVQLIFDLRYLLEIVNAKAGIKKEVQDGLRAMLVAIETRVDPFDYEMMGEALHQSLGQIVARTGALHLLLAANQTRRGAASVQRIDAGANVHNLIDLVGGTSGTKTGMKALRFGMLPISGYLLKSSSISASKVVPEPKVAAMTTVSKSAITKPAQKTLIGNNNNNAGNNNNRTNYLVRLGSNWF